MRKRGRGGSKAEEAVASAPVAEDATPPTWLPIVRWGFLPLLLVLVVVRLAWLPVEEPDIWFHMAHARYLLEHHAFPPGDVFSHTAAGQEWISTGWLAGVALYLLWEKAGGGSNALGITLYIVCQVTVAYLAIYLAGARRGKHVTMFVLLMAALVVGCLRFNARPDLCSQLLLALLLLLLVSTEELAPRDGPGSRRGKVSRFAAQSSGNTRTLWLLPVITMLWANLHAGFFVGLVVIAAYGGNRLLRWREERSRDDLMAVYPCAAAGVSWLINPYGWNLLKLPSKINAIPGVREMLFEWMPLYRTGLMPLPGISYAAIGVLMGLCAAVLLMRETRVPLWHWAVAAFVLWIAWNARRQTSLLAVALPALMLPHVGGLDRWLTRRPLVGMAAAVAAFALSWYAGATMLGATGWPRTGLSPEMTPRDTTGFLKRYPPPANMFNSFHFGAYLLYNMDPATKVFIDGRIDTYGPQVWSDDRMIEAGTMTIDAAIGKYQLNTFVVDFRPGYDPGQLAQRLDARKDFELVFKDAISAVFVRRQPATEEYLRRVEAQRPH